MKISVNVAIVFKALGIERDQEIAELVASEETTLALLAPSLLECQQMKIFSQQQAVEYIGDIIMRMKTQQPVGVRTNSRFQSNVSKNYYITVQLMFYVG